MYSLHVIFVKQHKTEYFKYEHLILKIKPFKKKPWLYIFKNNIRKLICSPPYLFIFSNVNQGSKTYFLSKDAQAMIQQGGHHA